MHATGQCLYTCVFTKPLVKKVDLLSCTYLNPLQVWSAHYGSLVKLDGGKVSLEETLEFQVGRLSGVCLSVIMIFSLMCEILKRRRQKDARKNHVRKLSQVLI